MTYRCACGGLLEVTRDLRGLDAELLKRIFAHRRAERHTLHASGVWRYKELIAPELPDDAIVHRAEGNTGLYASAQAARYAGNRQVWFKAQSENPSGSFKDNGMTAALSHGRAIGYRRFACTSTGNTSSSLALYAAYADCEAVILVPSRDVSPNKVLQTLGYGAQVRTFDGNYDDGIRYLDAHAEEQGLYVCNSINPMRIEGQKSIIFELAQDFDWQLPDWIVLPGGALSNAAALGKGLQELYALGFIKRLPRVAIIQAEGASPFHRLAAAMKDNAARKHGRPELVPEPKPSTRASALNIGNPPSWSKALRVLTETRGITETVSDAAILEAKAVIDASGIGCEPASAAGLAGLRQLVEAGVIDREETAACILTGHMLKDTDALQEYHLAEKWGELHRNGIQQADLPME
nr:threonine synthase [Paenibacillus phyllosphaerae]